MNLLKNPEEWANEYWWPPCLPNPRLVDFYDEKECYIWYLFTEEGADLLLEECANEEQGTRPEWLEEEISYAGTDIYDFGGSTECSTHYDKEGIGHNATWALENGIAPYQPFRIHLMPPHYYNCSWEYPGEVDVDWTWWADRTMRISDFDASRRWEHWIRERKLHFEWMDDRRRRIDHILAHEVESMHLDWELYCGVRSDDWRSAKGIQVSLKSCASIDGRMETKSWGAGRSDDGDRSEAMRDLLKKVKPRLPHIHGNKIRGMDKRGKRPKSIFGPIR